MPSDVRSGKRERAEAYASEAAEAARRGDHRKAAMLYQAAFLALENRDGGELGEPHDDGADTTDEPSAPAAMVEADCPEEAE